MSSTVALFAAGLAIFAPLTSAQIVVPGGSDPTAGAIYQPNLGTTVPAGKEFGITWKATSDGCGAKVDLVLLKGPSAAAMQAIKYIAKGVDNSGNYAWTPSTSLAPSASDYGIEMICQETQAYQYTTRFGISNPEYKAESSSSSTTATSSLSAYPTSSYGGYGASSSSASSSASSAASSSHSQSHSHTSATKSLESPKYPVATGTVTGGAGYSNGTEPKPTGSVTVPSSLRSSTATSQTMTSSTTKTASSSSSSSAAPASASAGAADHLKAGFGGLMAAAALAAYAL